VNKETTVDIAAVDVNNFLAADESQNHCLQDNRNRSCEYYEKILEDIRMKETELKKKFVSYSTFLKKYYYEIDRLYSELKAKDL
jgi:hypothetical protein